MHGKPAAAYCRFSTKFHIFQTIKLNVSFLRVFFFQKDAANLEKNKKQNVYKMDCK